ncbi:hypothetical protein F4778DRAFT_753110 [Xylariomycetidae sp. FL2044]|nr:hypothetical protein F4778DRAFT_753110 [Xylariomycetidae sp. FL2044]
MMWNFRATLDAAIDEANNIGQLDAFSSALFSAIADITADSGHEIWTLSHLQLIVVLEAARSAGLNDIERELQTDTTTDAPLDSTETSATAFSSEGLRRLASMRPGDATERLELIRRHLASGAVDLEPKRFFAHLKPKRYFAHLRSSARQVPGPASDLEEEGDPSSPRGQTTTGPGGRQGDKQGRRPPHHESQEEEEEEGQIRAKRIKYEEPERLSYQVPQIPLGHLSLHSPPPHPLSEGGASSWISPRSDISQPVAHSPRDFRSRPTRPETSTAQPVSLTPLGLMPVDAQPGCDVSQIVIPSHMSFHRDLQPYRLALRTNFPLIKMSAMGRHRIVIEHCVSSTRGDSQEVQDAGANFQFLLLRSILLDWFRECSRDECVYRFPQFLIETLSRHASTIIQCPPARVDVRPSQADLEWRNESTREL